MGLGSGIEKSQVGEEFENTGKKEAFPQREMFDASDYSLMSPPTGRMTISSTEVLRGRR